MVALGAEPPPHPANDTRDTRDRLSHCQRQVFEFIRSHIAGKGYPPTLREIGSALGVSSTNGVADHLRRLEKKGYIAREPNASRAIRLVRP